MVWGTVWEAVWDLSGVCLGRYFGDHLGVDLGVPSARLPALTPTALTLRCACRGLRGVDSSVGQLQRCDDQSGPVMARVFESG